MPKFKRRDEIKNLKVSKFVLSMFHMQLKGEFEYVSHAVKGRVSGSFPKERQHELRTKFVLKRQYSEYLPQM